MKVTFYTDLYVSGTYPQCPLFAFTQPHNKPDNCKRLQFSIEIPDNLLTGVDVVAPMPAKIEDIS